MKKNQWISWPEILLFFSTIYLQYLFFLFNDFGELKNIVKSKIVDRFDHALMVNSLFPKAQIDLLKQTTERIIVVDFQPTSENMVAYIAEILQQHLPSDVSLFSIRLYETVTSCAEWFASDNL